MKPEIDVDWKIVEFLIERREIETFLTKKTAKFDAFWPNFNPIFPAISTYTFKKLRHDKSALNILKQRLQKYKSRTRLLSVIWVVWHTPWELVACVCTWVIGFYDFENCVFHRESEKRVRETGGGNVFNFLSKIFNCFSPVSRNWNIYHISKSHCCDECIFISRGTNLPCNEFPFGEWTERCLRVNWDSKQVQEHCFTSSF